MVIYFHAAVHYALTYVFLFHKNTLMLLLHVLNCYNEYCQQKPGQCFLACYEYTDFLFVLQVPQILFCIHVHFLFHQILYHTEQIEYKIPFLPQ